MTQCQAPPGTLRQTTDKTGACNTSDTASVADLKRRRRGVMLVTADAGAHTRGQGAGRPCRCMPSLSAQASRGRIGSWVRPSLCPKTLFCLFSELWGQHCSSGGCPATAADCHHVRKVQFGRSITVWPRPEHYRKRTCSAEPVAQLLLAAARYVSLSRPASVCASTVTCDNTQTYNSTWVVQRMPM